MRHKNDYSIIVFFDDNTKPKKWSFIHKLSTTRRNFLDVKHVNWIYVNVYDRRKRTFIKRLAKEDVFPDFIDE